MRRSHCVVRDRQARSEAFERQEPTITIIRGSSYPGWTLKKVKITLA